MKHTIQQIDLHGGAKLLAIDVANSAALQLEAIVRGGSKYAPLSKYELSHLLEHLCFDGNKDYTDPQKFSFSLESLGIYANAFTSNHYIRYHFEGHIDDSKDLIALIFSQINQPLFLQKQISIEKEVITNEINRYKKDDEYLTWLQSAKATEEGVLSASERIESLQKISQADIKDFHAKTHVCENTYFLVSGSIADKLDVITEQLNKLLASYRRGSRQKYLLTDFLDYDKKIVIGSATHTNLSHFYVSFIRPRDCLALSPAFRILNCIYNVGTFSRVHYKARTKGLTYSTHSDFTPDRGYSEFGVADKTDPKKLLPLFELCMHELRDVLNGNFTDAEFKRAKGFSTRQLEISYQTPNGLANWYRGYFQDDDELDSPQEYLQKLKNVTRKDLEALQKEFFAQSKWIVSLLGNNLEGEEDKYKVIMEKYFGK